MSDKKGFILIWLYLVIIVLLILGGALLTRTISENRAMVRSKQLVQAFELAEAGIDTALRALKSNFDTATGVYGPFDLPITTPIGQYQYEIHDNISNVRRIRAWGYVPDAASPVITRQVEAYVGRVTPPAGYFDNTVWTTGSVTLKGTAYSVKGEATPDGIDNDNDGVIDESGECGNVSYGGQIIGDASNVEGDEILLSSDTEFYYLNFDTFRNIAISQNNLYTSAQLADKTYMKDHPFPTTFWRDGTTPNIVYLEGDLNVSGNIKLAGIFIVAKDVIASTGTADIGGTIDFSGMIYSLGNVRIYGTVTLSGSVWSGSGGAVLDGNVTLAYNYPYIDAFETYIYNNPSVNMKSWYEPNF